MNTLINNATQTLDTMGLRCPEPIMILRLTLRKMALGETLLVTADDPSTTRDIPKFCTFMEHQLLQSKVNSTPYQYLIMKNK